MIPEIFNPKSIAIIGATERENSVGRGIIENLKSGSAELFYVNPSSKKVFGEKSYNRITDIEKDIDLAVIAIPKEIVSEVVDDCIEKKVGGVLIVSAGFAETGEEGKKRQDEIAEKLSKAGIPLVGPNCLGILRPPVGLNASFAPGNPKNGDICLISQSGALIDSIIDGAKEENYGFSLIISVGNAAGLSLIDYIKIADEDPSTKVIALYIEGVDKGRELFNCLKKIKTPVVAIKGGKSEKSKKAICSHTGSLAGEHEIFSAALRQAEVEEVDTLSQLFDVSKALAWQSATGDRVAVVTNGGGAGVLLTDQLYEDGLKLAELNQDTIEKIENKMHPDYSKSNPLDIVGDALPERYEIAADNFLAQENVDVLVVIMTLQVMTDPLETAKRLVKLKEKHQKPILTVFMGAGKETTEGIDFLEENKIPNYSHPKRVAKPIKALNNKR